MDLSKYNPVAACDNAKRFDLIDPFSGEPIKDENGDVMGYSVVGINGTTSRNEDARIRRERPKLPHAEFEQKQLTDEQRAEQDEYYKELQKYHAAAGARKLAAMVTDLHGSWSNGDKQIKVSSNGGASDKAALAEMIERQDWIANQIAANASTLENYRPEM